MKKMKKMLVTLLSLLLVACTLLVMAGCPNENEGGEETTTAPSEKPTPPSTESSTTAPTTPSTPPPTTSPVTPPVGGTNVNYTIQVKTLGGMPLSDVKVYINRGTGEDEVSLGYAMTDAKGFAKISAKPTSDARVVLKNVPQGYNVNESGYTLTDTSLTVTLTSSVITDDTDLGGVSYELGSVMKDFTLTTYDGKKVQLSEILKEKEMVLLNFWYDGCVWCLEEFPALNEVYGQRRDEIEVIAISPYDDDAAIAEFLANYAASLPEGGLEFPLAYGPDIDAAFSKQGYPTSVVIDRYGVVCLKVEGAMTKNEFNAVCNRFTGANYVQELITDPSALTPIEKPDVEMPSSETIGAAVNAGDINITYYGETDPNFAEYAWPFVIGSKDGQTGDSCIKTSNAFKTRSYAILYADVVMKKGDVLAFDWFSSTEISIDMMSVIVDSEEIYTISGVSEEWQTCYPYVALEDGTYQLCFYFRKDLGDDVGEDTIYLDNFRIVTVDDIQTPTYIVREAATGLKEDASGYEHYVNIFYNENDGYYHVNSVDGPLLLANLMGFSNFSPEATVYSLAYNGLIVDANGVDYKDELEVYSNYSINGTMYGLCPVNQRLKFLLEKVAECVGLEPDEPRQWLQICRYYDAYGPDVEPLADPIKGLAPYSAYEAILSTEGNKVNNVITYTHTLMPRGYKYLFKPTVSGAYRIVSDSELPVDAWIFTANGDAFDEKAYLVYENVQRDYYDPNNCNMVVYFEAGKEYYISIGFWDVAAIGSLSFTVEFIGEQYDYFRLASPGPFTFVEGVGGSMGETIIVGIDVVLVDGYYHERRADGSVGSLIYADFAQSTPLFTQSILQMIEMGGFNFSMSEDDHIILSYIERYPETYVEELKAYYKDNFAEMEDLIRDVEEGVYHGKGTDLTEEIRGYLARMEEFEAGTPGSERNLCVAVDERLAEILQLIVDKYNFEKVENAWLKFCYYYDQIGV
ncbi:MAG: TlpA family protein disulfide reductase [Clostridia bacterium]|nr:TlpA family protein disulfide reductase [Clostridia bacterium]